MSARTILLIAAVLLLSVGTVFVARAWLDSQRVEVVTAPEPKKEEPTRVLVAELDLPAGTFIKEEHLRWQVWPDAGVPETYFIKKKTTPEDLYGAVVRRGLVAGEPITRPRIIKPGDRGFMAAVLTPGYRAMSINIGAAAGVAGLVFPGDRVDIILTHSVVRQGDGERRASETILENVRVLALDRRVNDETGEAMLAKTATMELTPKQVELLTVATDLGRLSLSLRSLAKDEEELERLSQGGDPLKEPEPSLAKTYSWDSEASVLVRRPKGKNETVSVVRGGAVQQLSVGDLLNQMMKEANQQANTQPSGQATNPASAGTEE
jgi:pilus assembly protein CpaB